MGLFSSPVTPNFVAKKIWSRFPVFLNLQICQYSKFMEL